MLFNHAPLCLGPLQHQHPSGGSLASLHVMYADSCSLPILASSVCMWCVCHPLSTQSAYVTLTRDFTAVNPNCSDNIGRSWAAIDRVAQDGKFYSYLSPSSYLSPPHLPLDLEWITATFKLCSPLTSQLVGDFQAWLVDTWFNLGMGERPCSMLCLSFHLLLLLPTSQWTTPTQLTS